jgi:amidase
MNTLSQAAASRCFLPYPAAAVPHAEGQLALSGLRFAVKDIFDVAGYPTGCGNPHMLAASGIKPHSARVVQTLLQAGAAFAGKVVTDELAFSLNGKNAHFGSPRNGAAPDRICGGSSSGSASAVSNQLCDFALGTDTGGSVRAPASHCGLIGLRPTHGRISLDGCMPLAPSLDTCGWLARDMAVFSRVGQVLLGADTVTLPQQPRFWLASELIQTLDPEVQSAFEQQLTRWACLGWPAPQPLAALLPPDDALYWAFRTIQGWEAWQSHGAFIRRHEPVLGPGVKERLAWSSQLRGEQMPAHQRSRAEFSSRLHALLSDGVLVLPTMPDVAPRLSQDEAALDGYRNQALRLLCLAGLAGCPQISLPLMRLGGIPLGLSLIGPPGSDRQLIALAARLLA